MKWSCVYHVHVLIPPFAACVCVWTGYPRFVINNTPYTPFAPFVPTAADTLPSLLPPGPSATSGAAPAHCHRIYELQKGRVKDCFIRGCGITTQTSRSRFPKFFRLPLPF